MDNRYTITHNILNYIIKFELSISKIDSILLPNQYYQDIYDKSVASSIDKLGEFISYPIGYTKSLEIQKGKLVSSSKYRIFTNYRSFYDFLRIYSSSKFIKPSIDLSTHVNKLLLKRIVDEWELGKLRTFSEKPNEVYDTWYSLRDFYPNLNPKIHFTDIYNSIVNGKIRIHKLIQLSILLFEYIDKAPYIAANQITALATISLILKEYGYNPKDLISPTIALESVSEDLKVAFKLSKSKRDMTYFIELFTYAMYMHAQYVENQLINLFNNKVSKYSKLDDKLNDRQVKIIEYLQVEKKISRNEYVKLMGITFMTAFRDLKELLDLGYLQQKGNGRGTYYILKRSEHEVEEEEKKLIFGD